MIAQNIDGRSKTLPGNLDGTRLPENPNKNAWPEGWGLKTNLNPTPEGKTITSRHWEIQLVDDYPTCVDVIDTMVDYEVPQEELELQVRIEAMREAYRQATQGMCLLAGVTPVNKLEDTEYNAVASKAYATDVVTASQASDTLLYTLNQLYRLDGDDAWSKI